MISIIVCYAHANPEFLELKRQIEDFALHRDVETVYVQHNQYADRRRGFLEAKGDVLLFLDADVLFPMGKLEEIYKRVLVNPPEGEIWTGAYLSPSMSGFQLRAYNMICNRWLGASDLRSVQPAQRILGGSFLASRRDLQALSRAFEARWGGEEFALVEQAQKAEMKILFHPLLQVIHRNHSATANFFRRAWTHGVSKQELQMSSTTHFVIRDWRNPIVIFWMSTHYSIVIAGNLFSFGLRLKEMFLAASFHRFAQWRRLSGSSKLKSNETLGI